MILKIKKGAEVKIIAGAEKGKSGKVLEINTKELLIKVEGIKMTTHYSKEGLVKKEGFIHYSNVQAI